MSLRKVTYSVKIGMVGTPESYKSLYLDYLKSIAIESIESEEEFTEFLVIYEVIPIKFRIYLAEDLNKLIFRQDKINKLDIIIFVLNTFQPESLNKVYKDLFDEFKEYYFFKGISMLIGVKDGIEEKPEKFITREALINKAKELDVMYCFEITKGQQHYQEINQTILDALLFKFQYSSPELLDAAKDYGIELLRTFEPRIDNLEVEQELATDSDKNEKYKISLKDIKIAPITHKSINLLNDPSTQKLLSQFDDLKQHLIPPHEEDKPLLMEFEEPPKTKLITNSVEETPQLIHKEPSSTQKKVQVEKPELTKTATIKKEILEPKRNEEKPEIEETKEVILTIEKAQGRRKCPKCGCEDKRMIHESIDRSFLICDYPRVYGKKFKCGECGVVFRMKYRD